MLTPDPQMDSRTDAASGAVRIVAVAVLYKRALQASESVSSLLSILERHPEWRACVSLFLYDNSPEPQEIPREIAQNVTYVHDPRNGGLAPAYEAALQQAVRNRAGWLLLLDQDTTLTEDYLSEGLTLLDQLQETSQIGAIVPKLVAKGTIYSPEADFLYQLRHQFQSMRHPVASNAFGIQDKPLSAYNSGAFLRVAALQKVSGFPAEFWLDYLDHAVFQRLHRDGFCIHVMHATLEQQLSHMDVNEVPLWRHRNVLTAQTRFVREFGAPLDHLLYRIYLLRICRFLFKQCRNRRVWKEMLLQILPLRVPSIRLGE